MDKDTLFSIRPSQPSDLPRMKEIFRDARCKMVADGNVHQWPESYPDEQILLNDMRRGFSYVVERDGIVVGTFVLALCEDPTYRRIYGGQWLDDERPYGTIHRIASADGCHGMADAVIRWCFTKTDNLRIDTHRDNRIMQHILAKHGFTYCGIILIDRPGDNERLAFQKLL